MSAGRDKDATDDRIDPAACLPDELRIMGMPRKHVLSRCEAGGQGKTPAISSPWLPDCDSGLYLDGRERDLAGCAGVRLPQQDGATNSAKPPDCFDPSQQNLAFCTALAAWELSDDTLACHRVVQLWCGNLILPLSMLPGRSRRRVTIISSAPTLLTL